MTAAELIEVALEIGNRIDLQWGLFVTVHLALLGAIVYLDQPLHRVEKLVALFVYTGFALINMAQMRAQLVLIDAAYADVHALWEAGDRSHLVARIAHEYESRRHQMAQSVLFLIHLLMFVLVLLSIIFDQALSSRPNSSAGVVEDGEVSP